MSRSFSDFVEDVKIMLKRTPPATDEEIRSYLVNNDVGEYHIDNIINGAKHTL